MSIFDYIVVAFYLAFMFLMGPIYKSFSKSASDFFRGGGGMLWWVVGSSTFMSTFSAWSFTGGAAKAYETGTFFLLLFACNILGYLFTYFFTAAKFRRMRVVTAIEAIRKRFGNTNEQVFAWLPIFSNLIIGGIYLYTISVFMYGVFGLNITLLIVLLGSVVFLMTLFGGSWAATAGDFVQMLILLSITLVMVFLTLKHPLTDGFAGLLDKIPEHHLNWSLFDRPWVVGFFAVTLLINQLVQNNSMTTTGGAKYVFVKNGRDARRSTLISIFGYLLLSPIWMIPAVAATYFHPDLASEFPMLNNPNEAAYVAMAQTLLPTGLLGLLVCAIFAATLTSINTFLNVSSGAFVRNFYIRVVNKKATESKQILVGRIFILIYGLLMILIAIYIQGLKSIPLFDLVLITAASIGIPSTIPLFYGIFFKKTPSWSAWSTMLVGFILAIVLRIVLTDDFISSLFSPERAFTGQELADLNIAITTGMLFVTCTAWYFGSILFNRGKDISYEKQVDEFFNEMDTPIDMEVEHVGEHESDSRQYSVLGKLCLIYGGFVMLLNFIPNSWESRIYISICGTLILSAGIVLRSIGIRIRKKIQA
ncbi:MAG: hypothetical protein QNK35_16705 [Bacteroides sp.]|nr:hypothetical protein [Bacteroides sp.]